eukprot:SM000111S18789  [mRNA]  locus=s111:181716:182249:- [translate_table: standard]
MARMEAEDAEAATEGLATGDGLRGAAWGQPSSPTHKQGEGGPLTQGCQPAVPRQATSATVAARLITRALDDQEAIRKIRQSTAGASDQHTAAAARKLRLQVRHRLKEEAWGGD